MDKQVTGHLGNNLHMTDFKSNIKNEKDSYGKGENRVQI